MTTEERAAALATEGANEKDVAHQFTGYDRIAFDLGVSLDRSDQKLLIWQALAVVLSVACLLAATTVTHIDILLDRGFRLVPLAGDVPLVAGFAVMSGLVTAAYIALLAVEADNRARFRQLAEALEAFRSVGYVGAHRYQYARRPPMTSADGAWWAAAILRMLGHAAPLLTLFILLIACLPMQDQWLIWFERFCLISSVLALAIARASLTGIESRWLRILRLTGMMLFVSAAAFSACAVLTIPGEPLDRLLRSERREPGAQAKAFAPTEMLFGVGPDGRPPVLWRHLSLANFDVTTISPAPRSRITLAGRRLRHAQLDRANLRHVDLTTADLQGALLQGADLEGAILSRTNFRNATLLGANLSAVRITSANFEASDLRGVRFFEARLNCPTADVCNLARANMDGAMQLPDGLQAAIETGRRLEGAGSPR